MLLGYTFWPITPSEESSEDHERTSEGFRETKRSSEEDLSLGYGVGDGT
jgi:hypothetical protein